MAYKKEKKKRHISEFDSFKKICQLNKKKSPITMLFCTEDLPDEWLIDVVEYRTKTGQMVDTYYVTRAEMKDYIRFCGKDGFDILTKF